MTDTSTPRRPGRPKGPTRTLRLVETFTPGADADAVWAAVTPTLAKLLLRLRAQRDAAKANADEERSVS